VRGQIPYCGPSSRGDVPAPHRQQVCGESVVAASIDRGPARGHTSRPPVIHAARPRERALIEAMRVCVCVRACVCPLSTSMRMSGFTCMRASRRHPNKTNTDAGTRAGCVRLYATISTHAVSSREQRRARLRPLRFKRRGGAGRGGGGARGGFRMHHHDVESQGDVESRVFVPLGVPNWPKEWKLHFPPSPGPPLSSESPSPMHMP